jgi:hypothetical protein
VAIAAAGVLELVQPRDGLGQAVAFHVREQRIVVAIERCRIAFDRLVNLACRRRVVMVVIVVRRASDRQDDRADRCDDSQCAPM